MNNKEKFYSIYVTINFKTLDLYLLRDKIEYEMNICSTLFEYLRLRGCKGVYTRILNPADGLIKIVYQKGHANPDSIRDEIIQVAKDFDWEVNTNGRTANDANDGNDEQDGE